MIGQLRKNIIFGLIFLTLFGVAFSFSKKVKADTYSPWTLVQTGPVQYENIIYNGTRPMIRKFRYVVYRRTYTDNRGNSRYLYKDEVQNLGLIPRY